MKKLDRKQESLETRVEKRIAGRRGDVFLRADFSDLGGYDQVGRALLALVRKGRLLKVSQGIYTRARRSPFSNELLPPKGLETLRQALRRVGVHPMPSQLELANNAGETTQVPTGRVVGVRRRVRRRIGYGGIFLKFERAGSVSH